MAELVKTDHIGITVSDLDRAVKFYEEGLHFHKTDEFLFTAYKDGFFGESAQARTLYGVAEGSTCRLAMMVPESGDTVLELTLARPEDTGRVTAAFPGCTAAEGKLTFGRASDKDCASLMAFLAEQNIPIKKLERHEPDLEDLFMEVIGK